MKQERVKEARRARVEALAVGRRPASTPSTNSASSKSPDLGLETISDEGALIRMCNRAGKMLRGKGFKM